MPGDDPNIPSHLILPLPDQSSYHMQHGHTVSPVFNGKFGPLHNVDIQISDACPKKFVIFDRTHDRSQIMFHPNLSSKLFHPGYDVKHSNNERDNMSALKEDSDDMDALLSAECDEYDDNYDDDMVSTARTEAVYRCDSPDSCSNYESLSMKSKARLLKSSRCNGKKHHRTRKLVNTLKGIVPGANRMSAVAVLDEAVRYLKALRVEVQKLGTGSSEG